MAVFLFNPIKDNSIYSGSLDQNTGLDEQLVVANSVNTLISFGDSFKDKISSLDFKAEVKLFLSEARELPSNFTIKAKSILDEWSEGIGNFYDYPVNKYGSTWLNKTDSNAWLTPGGNFGSVSSDQVVTFDTSKDLTIDVTDLVKSGSIDNGVVILSDDIGNGSVLYFSRHTKSIHKPLLCIYVDDSINIGSGSIVENDAIISTGNTHKISGTGKHRIDIFTRPRYVERRFRTQFKPVYFLPENSYYELRDVNVDYPIIKGDVKYTKISSDLKHNYIDLHIDNIPKHRYYELSVYSQTESGTEKIILPNHIYIG